MNESQRNNEVVERLTLKQFPNFRSPLNLQIKQEVETFLIFNRPSILNIKFYYLLQMARTPLGKQKHFMLPFSIEVNSAAK